MNLELGIPMPFNELVALPRPSLHELHPARAQAAPTTKVVPRPLP
ncbi:hypothetical protein [Stenotrophomonas maltophilia]|nr:hypothetical protein [Stenotrophomonas maltophilia]